MIYPRLATVAIALFVRAALASPLDAPGTPNLPKNVVDGAPIRSLTAHSNFTFDTHPSGFHVDASSQTFPATLFTFSGLNCAGPSNTVDLSTVPLDECFITKGNAGFFSLFIDQPSGVGLPFDVIVGPLECIQFADVPGTAVNECLNVNDGPFGDFAIIPPPSS